METLLNLVWAILAVAAVFLWAVRRRLAPASRFTDRTQAVALSCLLILLFFPISLTDDLHPEILLATDSLSQRRQSSVVLGAKSHDVSARIWGTALPFVPARRRALSLGFLSLRAVYPEMPRLERRLVRSVATRSPPQVPA